MKLADNPPAGTTSSRFRPLVINIAVAVAIFVVVTAFQTRNMLAADRQPAPELSGTTLSGQSYQLADAAGRPALVYFFAPWCKVCGASADNLARLRRWRASDDFEMVAVALDWTEAVEVRRYVKRHDLNVTVLLGDRRIAKDWKIYAFPSYYVLDSQHQIARRDIGYSTQLGLWWRALTVD